MKKWLLQALVLSLCTVHAESSEVTKTAVVDKTAKKSLKRMKTAIQKIDESLPKASKKPSSSKRDNGADVSAASQPVTLTAPVPEKQQPEKKAERESINKIAVLIYVTAPSQPGSDKELEKVSDIVITLLDIERPSIDGRMRSLEELILDKLMAFEAIYFYRMVVSDQAIDKYINSIKEHYNLSDDQLREMFKQAGYTYEEGREQLGATQAIDSLLNFKIKSRISVSEAAIREYYEKHPIYEEASYKIRKAFIPDGALTDKELENLSEKNMKSSSIEWSSAYWLMADEMTDERRQMLESMGIDGYSKPEVVTGGYEVVQLLVAKPRTCKSFEDSYREITVKLQEPQYYQMLDALKKELFAKYEVIYL